jgi:hypothetical protein
LDLLRPNLKELRWELKMMDASVVLTAPATHALANEVCDLTPNNVNFMIIIIIYN